jgi:hypothetical protein
MIVDHLVMMIQDKDIILLLILILNESIYESSYGVIILDDE